MKSSFGCCGSYIPKAKQKLVEAWIEIHKEELNANWILLGRGEQFFKIDPLK